MKQLSSSLLRFVLEQLAQGQSCRSIERQCGVSKTSVARIKRLVTAGGKATNDLLSLTDEALSATFYPPTPSSYEEPDWESVHRLASKKNVTLLMVYSQYEQWASGHAYTYPWFCKRYNNWRLVNGLRSVGGNVERLPGERMEIDFVGDKLEWIESSTGEIRYSKLFVATLPYSCIIFTEAFDDESQPSWILGIVDALEYFGGVPQVLVMDNAKALVSRADWTEPDVQAAVKSVCAHYGMTAWPCKPRTPNVNSAPFYMVSGKTVGSGTPTRA